MDSVRCVLVFLLLATLLGACQPAVAPTPEVSAPEAEAYWPTAGWHSSPPEAYGIDSAKLAEALLAIRAQEVQIHSLLVIRDGQVLADAYFYPYDGSTVHDLASVTKSVMTTLIAIAAGQGKLQLDAPLVSFFPERTIANLDARKERITVRHLASMASGLESMGYAQDEGSLTEMWASPDWVQFALDRPVVTEPGTHFVYDSPGMHLLSAILQQATGMTARNFAQENLFAPLGIEAVIWRSDPQGFSRGWGDLYLQPHDAAKIGYLWLNGGVWDGRQIVPSDWVEASQTAQIQIEGDDDAYGYGWWISDDGAYSAEGRGGQSIKLEPSLDVVVVTTGGGFDYDQQVDPLLSASVVDLEHALPANPAGVAQLEAALTAIAQPPAAQAVAPLPAIASTVSGQTYGFAPNPLEVDALRFEFDDSAEAQLYVTSGGSELPVWTIALDGVYRFFPGEFDLPQGLRGGWVDAQTFVFEYDEIANNDHAFYRVRFVDGRMQIQGQETAHALGVQVEGRLQTP